jgi:Protein of unknown function (DUF3617)
MRATSLATSVAILIAASAFNASPALAQDYPKLKPGQWEMTTSTTQSPDGKPHKMTMCTDAAVQKQMMDMGKGMSRDLCSKLDVRNDGGKYIGDSVCQVGATTMTSHSVMTVQGDTAYKTVVTATYDPPLMGMKDANTTIEGRNTGPCRDGLEPGDVITADGRKFNMKAFGNLPSAQPPAKAKQPEKAKVPQ